MMISSFAPGSSEVCRFPSRRGCCGCGNHDWKVSLSPVTRHFVSSVTIRRLNFQTRLTTIRDLQIYKTGKTSLNQQRCAAVQCIRSFSRNNQPRPSLTGACDGHFPEFLLCVRCRWLVLDTDTRDLVSMHTDGNEIISNVKYSPGKTITCSSHHRVKSINCFSAILSLALIMSWLLVPLDGNFLAVASHDNFVYIYAVTENGRKYSRVGKCTVRIRF